MKAFFSCVIQLLLLTNQSEKDKGESSSYFLQTVLGFPTVVDVNYSHGVRLRKVKERGKRKKVAEALC